MNALFVVGLATVVATMSIGGALLQERSRWLLVALWPFVVLAGASAWSCIDGHRLLWSGGRLREHLPNLVLVGFPSLVCLATLLILHREPTRLRIATALGVGVLGAVAAPFAALLLACAVTGDCL